MLSVKLVCKPFVAGIPRNQKYPNQKKYLPCTVLYLLFVCKDTKKNRCFFSKLEIISISYILIKQLND